MAIITACLLSCTSTKQNIQERMSVKDYYQDNPYAQPYLENPYLITEKQANTFVHAFKNHKYRSLFNKHKLSIAWSSFDTSTVNSVVRDQNTDSIVFLHGAFPRSDKSIPYDHKRHPFIILQGIPKQGISQTGKGVSLLYDVVLSQPIYFLPKYICPPPNTGCTIPGQQ